MSATEQEIGLLLGAYADRLEVSDIEIHRAQRRLRERLAVGPGRRRRSAAVSLMAAAVVGVLVLGSGWWMLSDPAPTAASPPRPATSSSVPPVSGANGGFGSGLGEDALALAGVWTVRGGGETTMLIRLDPEHTYAIDGRGHLNDPAAYGQFRLKGNRIVFTNLGGSACNADETWTWVATRRGDGRFSVAPEASSQGGACAYPPGTRLELTRVSPRSVAGVRLAAQASLGPAGSLVANKNEGAMRGVWLHEGTGRLLTVAADGSYAVDDGGTLDSYPDDAGTITVLGIGRVRLASRVDWETCRAGSRVAWSGVRVTATRLTITSSTDECPLRPRLAGRWVRLS